MTLLIGPISGLDTCTEDDPKQVLLRVLLELQPALTPEHVQVTPVDPPPDLDGPLWRWTFSDDAPQVQVLDTEVTTFRGSVEQGHWRPMTEATHAQIRGGLVVATEHGHVVLGVHQGDEDDDLNDLVEQALAHIQLIED